MVTHRDSDEHQLTMSLTAARSESDASSMVPTPVAGKRKKPEINSAGKFKVVSQLVVAMNRFKASLNPTYTFGKRSDSSSTDLTTGRATAERTEEATSPPLSASVSSPKAEPAAARKKVYSTHGHRTNYILQPLSPAAPKIASDGL